LDLTEVYFHNVATSGLMIQQRISNFNTIGLRATELLMI